MNDSLPAINAKRRTLTLLSWAAMVFAPFLLLLSVSLALGRNVFMSYPVWTDELDYWRCLYNWLNVGFQTGYSGICEIIPAAGTLSVHGFTPIMLYGWFVKLFGLGYSSIVICNAVWISLGALVFCALCRPKPAIALLFTGLLLCYAPIVLYCATSMTELFNFALLLFYLAFLFSYHEKRKPWLLVLCCLTVFVGCLYRITYFLLFIPLFLVYSQFKPGRRMTLSAISAAALALAAYLLSSRYTAPYSQGFLYHLMRAEDLGTFVQMLLSHTKSNLIDYFILPTGSPMQDAFRWLYCGVTALCLIGAFVRVERKEKKLAVCYGFSFELLCCFLMLLCAFGLIAVLYETNDWSDFRTLAPFLWLVAGYLILRKRYLIPAVTLAASVATLVILVSSPPVGAFADEWRFQKEPYNEKLAQVAEYIVYDADAQNPFTNTVRIDIGGLQAQEELAPGLGLQYGWFTPDTTGKSNWILTDHLKCVVQGYEAVIELPQMNVYRLSQSYEVPSDGE